MFLTKIIFIPLKKSSIVVSPKHGRGMSIFSGGTAANSFVQELNELSWNISYVLGISDNGGSSAEVSRVLKGPAIGDIRSRLIRLAQVNNPEGKAVYKFLSHRLNKQSRAQAILDWYSIMDANPFGLPSFSHDLWKGIPRPQAGILYRHLKEFDDRVKSSDTGFDYRNGSVGNFFFSGSRLMYDSMEIAIYMFSKLIGIPDETGVLPVLNSEKAYTIAALLQDGSVIKGQNEISHPGRLVDKLSEDSLSSPIKKIFYINEAGSEIVPSISFKALESIQEKELVVFSMGSFFTSIVPCLILPGMGEVLSAKKEPKVFVLNGKNDRETLGMTVLDFIESATNALNRYGALSYKPNDYITHLIVPSHEVIEVDKSKIEKLGIKIVEVDSEIKDGCAYYDKQSYVSTLSNIE